MLGTTRTTTRTSARLATAGLALLLAGCCDASDDGAGVRSGSNVGVRAGSGVVGTPLQSASAPGGSASGPAAYAPEGATTGAARPPAAGALGLTDCWAVGATSAEPVATAYVEAGAYSLRAIPATVPAGVVQVVGHNAANRPHSIVLARLDEGVELPTDESGAVDVEQLPEGAVVGELREFAPQATCAAAFDLQPGRYALFCYLVEDMDTGEPWSHHGRGTATVLTVG